MQRVSRLLVLILAVASAVAPAQIQSSASASPATRLAFDVVTIKRDMSGVGGASIQSPGNGDFVALTNMSTRRIIGFAYDLELHDSIYGLPTWADSETYDITAKVAAADLPAFHSLLPRERNPMLRSLLAERFHLQAHFEPKEIPAYALVVAKSGSKLSEVPAILADGGKDPGATHTSPGRIASETAPMANLIAGLSVELGRPVVDHTGLAGRYSYTLQFSPAQASSDTQQDTGPSLFTAVQDQLGLKLEPIKTPTPVLVVDHIERPSEN